MKQLKKIIVTLLAISVVASTFMMSASAGEIAYGAGTVKANILNIRSGPGTNYDVKGTVTDGSIVVILEKHPIPGTPSTIRVQPVTSPPNL